MDFNHLVTYENAVGVGMGMGWIVFAIVLIFVIAALAVQIGVCIWVYKDAKKYNMESPGLWVLLCLFIPFPIGLIVYIVVRNNNKNKPIISDQYCPSCKAPTNGNAFCPNCGTALLKSCPNCNAQLKEGWNNCPNCGTKV